MAYFKRQVKSLTDQIQQQQQKITELRYRSTSPGPLSLSTVRHTRIFILGDTTKITELRNGLEFLYSDHSHFHFLTASVPH